MLPGALLQEPGRVKRTFRDWLVDILMFVLAVAVGVIAMVGSDVKHSEFEWWLEAICGPICLVAIWWRRRWPVGVGFLTTVLGTFSGLAVGAGAVGLFNLAVRGSRRALIWIFVLSEVSAAI